jgi:hypothetical protein
MRIPFVALLITLGGCATSAAGLYQSKVEMTVESAKSAQSFATCSVETMIANNQLRNEGDHYWILRMNGYGVPVARWDFTNKPGGGSVAELRSSIGINTGDDRVKGCA